MILQSLHDISMKYGSFNLHEYFTNSGNDYVIFAIDYDYRDFVFLDGVNSQELKDECLRDFNFENGNISALYGQRELNSVVEVFMFNNELINSTDIELRELIIFHEICHLLEKTNYFNTLGLTFSEDEIRVGQEVQSIANEINEIIGGWGNDEHHNATFGKILFHYLKQFNYPERFRLLGKSLLMNFLDDYSKEFEKTIA